jgi:hypothetical protein
MGERAVSGQPFHTRLRRDCGHDGAREIRMHTSYADANAIRGRLLAPGGGWRHVSELYEIPGGWAWSLCNECPADVGGAAPPSRAVGA